MKTKIISIFIITTLIVSLSVIILSDSIKALSGESSFNLSENYMDEMPQKNADRMFSNDIPVYKKRNDRQASYIRSENKGNANNIIIPSRSVHYTIFSSNPGVIENIMSEVQSSTHQQSANYSPVTTVPIFRKTENTDRVGTTPKREVLAENHTAKLSKPFSNSSIPGPMRMEGDDENPPAEGAPIGEGMAVLLIFASLYFFKIRRK